MPVINTHQNIAAFLDMLAVSEGTANHPLTKNRGYDVIVTGLDGKPEIFTDYSDHPFAHGRPAKVFNRRGEKSTASGRYQQLYPRQPGTGINGILRREVTENRQCASVRSVGRKPKRR